MTNRDTAEEIVYKHTSLDAQDEDYWVLVEAIRAAIAAPLPGKTKPMDPEIQSLRAISHLLSRFDYKTRKRMLEWAWGAFVVDEERRIARERIEARRGSGG